ncbi:MAG TPA: hypothetical protein VM425_01280 [Myxococcota bacterium]|nr:hypothetical protein [Myxococcota bacterium]
MYNTLQDFTAHAKGTSYVLAGLILVAVVVFWIFLNKKVTRK